MQNQAGLQAAYQGPKPRLSPVGTSSFDGDQPLSPQTLSVESTANSKKRPYPTRVTRVHPRKRAPTACELCRARKTKCDNARPTCGCCAGLDADCVYHDSDPATLQFDPASLSILAKLDHITSLLESSKDQEPVQSHGQSKSLTSVPPSHVVGSEISSNGPAPSIDQELGTDIALKIPSSPMTPDNILAWPIFESHFQRSLMNSQLYDDYITRSTEDDHKLWVVSRLEATSSAARDSIGVFGDSHLADIPQLVEHFLSNVHTKNPFLDIDSLRAEANRVSHCGLDWGGWTCIVLITSALGSISKPFEESRHDMTFLRQDKYSLSSASVIFSRPEIAKAAFYYHHARQRIGLLKHNLVAIQCYLLSGMYQMYVVQPIEAWNNFSQACGRFWIHLQGSILNPRHCDGEANYVCLQNSLEQRLYWSCFKSESELRNQLDFPASGIADLSYPVAFPSPPISDNTVEDSERQKSWFYYTTDISMRRLGNSILNTFYTELPAAWLKFDIDKILSLAEEFESQLIQTHECLPECLKYDYTNLDAFPTNELAFSIRGRVLGILASLYNPFLYLVIHCPKTPDRISPLPALPSKVQQLAQKAVQISLYIMRGFSIRHRHHGLWFSARHSVAAGLVVMAAVKSGAVPIPQEWDWRVVVETAARDLEWWREESKDIGKGADVLRQVMSEC